MKIWCAQRGGPNHPFPLLPLFWILLFSSTPAETLEPTVVVDLSQSGLALRIDGEKEGDGLGSGVAACDFDGDGLKDLALGAWRGDGVGDLWTDSGEVSIIRGARRRWLAIASVVELRSTYIVGQDGWDNMGLRLACGDLNGDRKAELILGAPYADGKFNTIESAGQIHLFFGVDPLPSFVDFKTDPGPVVYGGTQHERLGTDPAAGELNGDGTTDLMADAPGGLNRAGTVEMGRLYLLFGKQEWPVSSDVASDADVTFIGPSVNSDFPSDTIAADLNGDGIDDVVSADRLGNTPASGREDAGDVFVFRGRLSWPKFIELQTTPGNLRIFGADAFDYTGAVDALSAGDLDNDGTLDLAIGVQSGDGPSNGASRMGEIRVIAPPKPWPTSLDLRTETRQIVYGQRAGDALGTCTAIADFNGDGMDDLGGSIYGNDGVDGSRAEAGGAVVVLGRNPFPVETEMALGQEDWRIIGALPDDQTYFKGISDINDDGISELVLANGDTYNSIPPSVWIVSPVDIDGDGFTQLADVCPLVYDPNQADDDGDGRGNACALDWDGDGDPDLTDCRSNDPNAGKPVAIKGLLLTGSATTILSWPPSITADTYDVLRGLASDLDGGDYGACQNARDPDLTDTTFTETELPPAGGSFIFLVRGRDADCGGAGSLSTDSSGQPRINTNPADCQ